jgi:hypothetical protein
MPGPGRPLDVLESFSQCLVAVTRRERRKDAVIDGLVQEV